MFTSLLLNKKRLIASLFFAFVTADLVAQFQLKGGEITITKNGAWHDAKVYLLVDWPVAATKAFVNIDWGDGSAIESLPFSGSDCTYPNATNLLYTGMHTFAPNGIYTVTVIDSFFIPDITNIPNSGSQKLVLRQIVTTAYTPIYNSPVHFGNEGCLDIGRGCYSTDVSQGQGADEANSDSLGFVIVGHPEIPGYVIPPAVADVLSGMLSFSVDVAPGKYNICLRIDEWRHLNATGPPTLMGSNFRDYFLWIDNCIGLKENSLNGKNITLYPNPCIDNLTIESGESGKNIYIINAIGQIVLTVLKKEDPQKVDITRLPTGFYIARIGRSSVKFQKLPD